MLIVEHREWNGVPTVPFCLHYLLIHVKRHIDLLLDKDNRTDSSIQLTNAISLFMKMEFSNVSNIIFRASGAMADFQSLYLYSCIQ